MPALALMKTSFQRNRVYVLNHMLNNLGSFLFGYIIAMVWLSLLGNTPEGREMVTYVMVNQAMVGLVMFLPRGCFIPQKIREGTIVFDLVRPQNILSLAFFEVSGHVAYNFVFRSLPIFLLGFLVLGVDFPRLSQLFPFFLALANGFVIAFFLNYLVGLWSMHFVDFTGAQNLYYFTTATFSGYMMPPEFFPGFVRTLVEFSPFGCTHFWPSAIYLGRVPLFQALWIQWSWIGILWVTCWLLTRRLVQRIPIQGG
ncbi:MAG TPA: ABC-2 family transporter protein [Thermotogota bacterium]|nr:ABC-2 family transporter protein [Thermotogota bacterium]HRW92648.1 ABC-2 family transporter protein [Thermotogota bacterium]